VGGVDEVVLDSACGGRDGMRLEVLLAWRCKMQRRLGLVHCSTPARSIGGSPGNEWQRGVTLSTRDDAMHW
jgi:hypothetical protein